MGRVLIAENDADTRLLLSQTLKGATFQFVVAQDGADAYGRYLQARRDGQPFDLLVLDIAMPGLDGLTFARKVREAGDPVMIAFFTATSEPANTTVLLFHPVGFWIKPRAVLELRTNVERVLAGKRSRIEDKDL